MDDDGTVVDRGPRGSGSLVVSLDALKQRNRDIPVEFNNNELVSSMQITMATPPLNRTQELYFRGFNFRGLPINREIRKNWTPRKFPAIRSRAVHVVQLVSTADSLTKRLHLLLTVSNSRPTIRTLVRTLSA